MLISIIIPVYNTSEYLRSCLSSVLANDCADCEILLVDDGSTDGSSPKLCDELSLENPGMVRVIHQENLGLGGARNTGIDNAGGDYLFFVDSDDRIAPHALSRIKETIACSNADIIAFNLCSDDGLGKLTPIDANYLRADEPFCLSSKPEFLLSLPSAWSRVWKRKIFLESGIRFPTRVWYEDIRTTTKLFALAKNIVTIEDRLYLYLQRPGSIMNSANAERCREIMWAFDDIIDWFKSAGLWSNYKDILCRLCIDHVYIAASVRVLRADPKHKLLKEFADFTEIRFPDWESNPHLGGLPSAHKLLLALLRRKQYGLIHFLFKIKG